MPPIKQILLALTIVAALMIFPPTAQALTASKSVVDIGVQDFLKSGINNLQSDNYQAAIADFTAAIAIDANNAAAFSNRCLAYIQLAEYQTAIEDCTEGIHLNSHNRETYLNRGLAYYKQGNLKAAIADYNQVISIAPLDFRAYYNLALAQSELKSYKDAIASYDRTLSLIPLTQSSLLAEVYNDRGIVRLMLEDGLGAVADFSQAIALNGNDYRAFYNRACASRRQGNFTAAIADFSQALQLNPINAEAYLNRGIAYYELGYEREAIEDLQQAAQHFLDRGKVTAYHQIMNQIKQFRQPDSVLV